MPVETDWIVYEEQEKYFRKSDLLLKEEVYEIVGICMEVHRNLGPGFLEIVYKAALEQEFKWKEISYEREKKYSIEYKGAVLPHDFYADFVIGGNIILEVKAQQAIPEVFYAQLINYLAVSKCEVGILVNFSEKSLVYKRFVRTK